LVRIRPSSASLALAEVIGSAILFAAAGVFGRLGVDEFVAADPAKPVG
jgi:hypothetical protein